MRQRGIPRDVETFIKDHLSSVAQLEILLLLHGEPESVHTPHSVGERLRIDPAWAATELERLCRQGVCATAGDGGDRYHYGPPEPQTHEVVDRLAKAFSTHRVSVITLIFSTPSDSVGSFADAFKLRRDQDG